MPTSTRRPPTQSNPTCSLVTITSPRPGDQLQGTISIEGSAALPSDLPGPEQFQFYKVEYSSASQPELWRAVSRTYEQPKPSGTLDTWDTSTLPDGEYNLKLTVVDRRGQEVCRDLVHGLQIAQTRSNIYELRGTIDDISEDGTAWIVAGQPIQVTTNTVITNQPAVGRIARVLANRLEDGTFVAKEIEVERATTPVSQKVFLSGVLTSRESENAFYVAGQRVRKDNRTTITGGDLNVGVFVDVKGIQESATTILADEIAVMHRCENPILLEGTIASIGARLWVIDVNGTQVSVGIDQHTEIMNEPVVGAHARLETCRTGDTYIAQRIHLVPQ